MSRVWRKRLKVLSVLLEGNWTWVLLHPRSIEIRISFCLWHFSLLYRWLSCHWACTNQERRWPWDLMNNIKVHLLIWAELDLNDDIYIMADDNMNCGILTLEIFFSYFYGKTKRLCWMKLYKESIWNALLSESCLLVSFSSIFLFLFFFFPGYDTCVLFSLPKQKCFSNYDVKPLICRNTKNDKRIATVNGLTLEQECMSA